ncbi:MAG: hypothetical protein ACPGVN_00465 [Alphaproteobacteria bacterium]
MTNDFRERLLSRKKTAQALYKAFDAKGYDPARIGRAWSKFADHCINTALIEAWRNTPIANKLYKPEKTIPGLFVLGLGKLGGFDLNYSSDVDLVAFFDADLVPIPEHVGRTHVCAQVLRTMTRLLDKGTDARFVWRVDWRLRPDPSMTDLAISTQAGENYYFFRAAPWRRLSMVKARVVAGDMACGQRFLKDLHPYVWRRHLEFKTLDEIASLKTKIRQEHPDLKAERIAQTPMQTADGFHLKLGLGGIREIEFYVNAQQLLLGGRVPSLQTTNTMQALNALVQESVIEEDLGQKLQHAYWLFRSLENRVQYLDDKQTHNLPTDPDTQAWLAQVSGFEDWTALGHALRDARELVAPTFDRLLNDNSDEQSDGQAETDAEEQDFSSSPNDDPNKTLDEACQTLVLDWTQEPFRGYGVTSDQSKMLLQVGQELTRVALATDQPNNSVRAIHKFLQDLGQPGEYLRLFRDQPRTLAQVILPLLQSPAMHILLEQSPHVIDGLLARAGSVPRQPDLSLGREMLDAAFRDEAKLEAARAWVNEQLYMCFLSVFENNRSIPEAEAFLTRLAEGALALVGDLVALQHKVDRLPFAVLGLGKLGMQAMAPRSDLDLIFVVPDEADYQAAQRLASKFISSLNAKMREGQVYEIDMRLRPSGRSGPVVVTFSQFQTYQMTRAKTWEHMALAAMRPVAGHPQFCEAIAEVKAKVQGLILSGGRNVDQLYRDACKMLFRLRADRVKLRMDDPFEIKLRPGGLMETEYFLNFLSLRHGVEIATLDDVAATEVLATLHADFENLVLIRRNLRDWTFAHRLWGPNWPQHTKFEFDEGRLNATCQTISDCLQKHLIEPCDLSETDLADYDEMPVAR